MSLHRPTPLVLASELPVLWGHHDCFPGGDASALEHPAFKDLFGTVNALRCVYVFPDGLNTSVRHSQRLPFHPLPPQHHTTCTFIRYFHICSQPHKHNANAIIQHMHIREHKTLHVSRRHVRMKVSLDSCGIKRRGLLMMQSLSN